MDTQHEGPTHRPIDSIVCKVLHMPTPAAGCSHDRPLVPLLRSLFKFTRAEAGVADLIADGLSATDVARRLGISPATVRTHLSRIFAKTETRRQAQLAATLAPLRTIANSNVVRG